MATKCSVRLRLLLHLEYCTHGHVSCMSTWAHTWTECRVFGWCEVASIQDSSLGPSSLVCCALKLLAGKSTGNSGCAVDSQSAFPVCTDLRLRVWTRGRFSVFHDSQWILLVFSHEGVQLLLLRRPVARSSTAELCGVWKRLPDGFELADTRLALISNIGNRWSVFLIHHPLRDSWLCITPADLCWFTSGGNLPLWPL